MSVEAVTGPMSFCHDLVSPSAQPTSVLSLLPLSIPGHSLLSPAC